jgi:hypothetical protein
MKTVVLSQEDLEDIKWLAELVKAQALSERNQLAREYIAYNDRDWMPSKLNTARAKVARCESVLEAISGTRCVRAHVADAGSIGLDWCRTHDKAWDLSNKRCGRVI